LTAKAILFDYVGTLVQPRSYSMERSKSKLHKALCGAGLNTEIDTLMEAYAKAHEKQRVVRCEQLREVTNAVWVSEALCNANCRCAVDDSRLKAGLNVFFQDFIDTLELRPHAKQVLTLASQSFKVGLVSNFTYAPAIYASLRKLGINGYFNAVVVSEAVGWRKPHKGIFNQAIGMLRVKAEEAVFVGDSPQEDMEGAKAVGMQTVFVASGFSSLANLEKCGVKPDMVVGDLAELLGVLPELLTST
jgi:HAD superfamily hydrolase (TIGR01509 family)